MDLSRKKQDGAILFVVLTIMLMVSILVMMALQRSKTNVKVSLAQAQQIEAFDNAEAMLSRIRAALSAVKEPPWYTGKVTEINSNKYTGVPYVSDNVDPRQWQIVWNPAALAKLANEGVNSKIITKNSSVPLFAHHGFQWEMGLTCEQMEKWLKSRANTTSMDCVSTFSQNEENEPRIFIEGINEEITGNTNSRLYRITVKGQGFHSGSNIVQGFYRL